MVQALPAPEVIRCYFDDTFARRLPAMCLRWRDCPGERLWELPEGVTLMGPPPERFGVTIQRIGTDAYEVRLLWDGSCFVWKSVRRVQLLTCALTPLLGALGTDIWYLLDQPVNGEAYAPRRAA
jgi:hypothetical protein